MGAETLLTLLGLLIAAYAVLPVERQLDLKLRLKPLDWLVAATALILIHYIQFYPVLSSLGVAPDLGSWRWGFDAENASYLIVLVAVVFIYSRARTATVRPSTISTFRNLTERLVSEERFSQALFLLERHLSALFRVYNSDYFLLRLRQRLAPQGSFRFGEATSTTDRLRRFTARLLPVFDRHPGIAGDTVRRFLVYEPFVSYLAKARPYFALVILNHEFSEREDFLTLYIRALLRDKTSIIYDEIRHNQNLAKGRRYEIVEENRLIHYFLADARVAERMAVWKPFGDFTLGYLDHQFRNSQADPYNLALGTYYEAGRWECPIHATVWFFEAMVSEALYQGIEWHMWLYYLPPVVERIVRNLSPDFRTVEIWREWPTAYHYLLYAIFDVFSGWIESAADLPPTQENVALRNEMIDHENGNIPKSAILALGICLRSVMLADAIDERFRAYLLDVVLRAYFDLLKKPTMQPFCRILRDVIVQGGFSGHRNDREYSANVRAALEMVDQIPFLGPEWTELLRRVEERAA
ncbi:MAG: hypothetical protein ACHQ9S_25495 [Candidatus Binatia bacterium]